MKKAMLAAVKREIVVLLLLLLLRMPRSEQPGKRVFIHKTKSGTSGGNCEISQSSWQGRGVHTKILSRSPSRPLPLPLTLGAKQSLGALNDQI